jgi:Right handed beta helix region
MVSDKTRALICVGFLCVTAAVGGGTRAAEVYPGCAVPPTTFNHVWYVDPVNGKSPAAGGVGSQTAPWNSLQGVVSSTPPPGYPRPLLSSIPYVHRQPLPGTTQRVYADQAGAVVQPGDEILLMSGQYGDISIGAYAVQVTNSAFVAIAAAAGQTPVFSSLAALASSDFMFSGIKVQSVGSGRRALINIGDGGPTAPTSNIVLDNLNVSAADPSDYATWTQAQWAANTTVGISALGSDNGANTNCISVVNSHITANHFGLAVFGNNMLVTGNEIDHFGDDGIDYGASNLLMTKNYIHDPMNWKIGAHMDGMQGYPGRVVPPGASKTFKNLVIDSNKVIRQTDPNLPFPTDLQGIDAFDGDWANLTVTNNVIVTSACWGIGYASVHGGKIVNNTVVSDGWIPLPCKPLVAVGDKTHDGLPSNDVIIRNNIANGLTIYNVNPNMVMDHNLCLTIEGKCQIITYANGKPNWGISKPGQYGDHNIVDARGSEGEFVAFDPAKFVFDLRLKPGARAIGAGNPAEAPPVDVVGTPRGTRIDAGAYQRSPDK